MCQSRTRWPRSRRSAKATPIRSRNRRSSWPARSRTCGPARRSSDRDAPACPGRAGGGESMPLKLEIVTPERMAYRDEVDAVTLPGSEGELGVLPHHAPLITTLGAGELRLRKGGQEESFAIVGGFLQVLPDKVVVMAETADMASEIDLERAQEARQKAEQALESGFVE